MAGVARRQSAVELGGRHIAVCRLAGVVALWRTEGEAFGDQTALGIADLTALPFLEAHRRKLTPAPGTLIVALEGHEIAGTAGQHGVRGVASQLHGSPSDHSEMDAMPHSGDRNRIPSLPRLGPEPSKQTPSTRPQRRTWGRRMTSGPLEGGIRTPAALRTFF